jgi:hypothetical protein
MSIRANRILRLAVATAITAAAVLTATAQSSFAVGCTWNACSGKDPQAMGCTDAITQREVSYHHGDGDYRIELRYSANCHSVWVRMTSDTCNFPRAYLQTGYVSNNSYVLQGIFVGPNSGSGCADEIKASWTPMSSRGREILTYGYARHDSTTPIETAEWDTGCDNCNF